MVFYYGRIIHKLCFIHIFLYLHFYDLRQNANQLEPTVPQFVCDTLNYSHDMISCLLVQ